MSTSTFAAVTTTIAHPAAAPTIATTATMHPRGLWSHLYGVSLLRGARTYMLPQEWQAGLAIWVCNLPHIVSR